MNSTPERPRGRPFRSKLIPFARQIAKWQREGKTYLEMALLLRPEPGMEILHPDTIHSFVMVRFRASKRKRAILSAEYLNALSGVPAAPRPALPRSTAEAPGVPAGDPARRPANRRQLNDAGKEITVAVYPAPKLEEL
jgi:hypothetical protein